MTLETFKQIVFLLKKDSERSDKLYKLGMDVINFNDELHGVINLLFKAHYSEEGEDMISWWLWEDTDKFLFDGEGNQTHDLTKIEDIWKYVEEIRKSPDFVEYTPEVKKKMTKKQMEKMFKGMFS